MAQALDFELLFNEISNGSADIDDEEDEMDFAVCSIPNNCLIFFIDLFFKPLCIALKTK